MLRINIFTIIGICYTAVSSMEDNIYIFYESNEARSILNSVCGKYKEIVKFIKEIIYVPFRTNDSNAESVVEIRNVLQVADHILTNAHNRSYVQQDIIDFISSEYNKWIIRMNKKRNRINNDRENVIAVLHKLL